MSDPKPTDPPSPRPRDSARLAATKQALIDAGLEVFRSRGDEIVLAERPRENLIMDSGVRLAVGDPYEIRVVLRAQKTEFPNEEEPHLFDRVRRLAGPALLRGYAEIGAAVMRVEDPGGGGHTLDTFYEVTFAKRAAALDEALDQVRFALSLEKRA